MKHTTVEDHRKIKTCFVVRAENGLINYDAMTKVNFLDTRNNKRWPPT
jgi:hypothetical protein